MDLFHLDVTIYLYTYIYINIVGYFCILLTSHSEEYQSGYISNL